MGFNLFWRVRAIESPMKNPNAITVALIKNPQGSDWQAQIQIEYKNNPGKDALNLSGDNPMQLLERSKNAIGKKFINDSASQ